MTYTIEDFCRMAVAEFHELASEFDEWGDLGHLKVGALAYIAQHAKREANWDRYRRCLGIVDELLGKSDSFLENALYVSFLEEIDFDGRCGPKAWECLTPRLKVAWKEIRQYNDDIAAMNSPPQKAKKKKPRKPA